VKISTASLTGAWQFCQAGADEWLPATVPGGVHTDLLAAGRIPDPFVADNEKKVAWVAEQDWDYRRIFAVRPETLAREKLFLVCDGLDTLADGLAQRRSRWADGQHVPPLRVGSETACSRHRRERAAHPLPFARPVRDGRRTPARPLRGVTQAIDGGPTCARRRATSVGIGVPAAADRRLADIRLEGRMAAALRGCTSAPAPRPRQRSVSVRGGRERWSDAPLAAIRDG
jgi:beta-mannosidase